jgi:dipeptidyl aminopeptidase/acylaminoacyl peptidase
MARPMHGGQSGRAVPPILFLLGKQDRRVPPMQGLHMAESLRQAGFMARVLNFPDDCHPLTSVEAEMESWVSTLMFFVQNS